MRMAAMVHRRLLVALPILALAAACGCLGGMGCGHPAPSPEATPPAEGGPATAVIYSCPMHPEVTANAPGACPKCGMTLVAKQ